MNTQNIIFDCSNIEHRVYHIINATSQHISQEDYISRVMQMIQRIINQFNPLNIYCAWDKKLTWPSTNFRKQLLAGQYKANRVKNENAQIIHEVEPKIVELLESIGVKNVFPNKLEADDVCAWLSINVPGQTVIVSGDQDLLQLITPTVSVYNFKELITYENFETKKQVPIQYYTLFKAIKGDVSDNIEGIAGYGDVKARKLATTWHLNDQPSEYKHIVETNLRVIDLKTGFKHEQGEEEAYQGQVDYLKDISGDANRFKLLCEKYKLTSLQYNIEKWMPIINRMKSVDLIRRLA